MAVGGGGWQGVAVVGGGRQWVVTVATGGNESLALGLMYYCHVT